MLGYEAHRIETEVGTASYGTLEMTGVRIMGMPQFTAEAALYRTRGQYRTGRNAVHLPARMISPIHPARMEDEVIHVHSCAPGWIDIGGSCWPAPLTEPSSSGSAGGGMPGSGGGGSGGGASGGLGDYWACRNGCEIAYSKCLDTCEGTPENPKPSRNCLICDENYQRCLDACSRNIA
jgi:hypothetical protein